MGTAHHSNAGTLLFGNAVALHGGRCPPYFSANLLVLPDGGDHAFEDAFLDFHLSSQRIDVVNNFRRVEVENRSSHLAVDFKAATNDLLVSVVGSTLCLSSSE